MRFSIVLSMLLFACVFAHAQTPFDTIGKASFYAKEFTGRKTASGEIFSNNKYMCAHRTLPFGTKLKVTNLANKKWCVVTVTDRGPYAKGRVIDLSRKAASDLDFVSHGTATVLVEEITDDNECRLIHSHDTTVAKKFPQDWVGDWCGVLESFNANGKTQVRMQLNIHRGVDSLHWQWQIVYDTSARNYELVTSGDSLQGSYSIDEKNGVVLPATLMGNTLVSSFEVQGNRIDALYTLRDDEILLTLISVANNNALQTGLGTDVSPKVNAYSPTAYQSAVLTRRK